MKIKISRSYSAKKQLRQFEPIDAFCAAEIEEDTDNIPKLGKDGETIADIMIQWSEDLDKLVRAEVKKTLDAVFAEQEKLTNKKNRKVETKEDAKNTAELDLGLSEMDEKDFHEAND